MSEVELWLLFKKFFIDLVKYGFPTVAIVLSFISFIDSRKAQEANKRINSIEEKLKKYELEEKEKERAESNKARIEARVYKISEGNYKMKIWNSGKATAYNIDFSIPEEYNANVWRDKVPYECLESGKSFEEIVLVHGGTDSKFKVITTWSDKKGSKDSKEQLVTIEPIPHLIDTANMEYNKK